MRLFRWNRNEAPDTTADDPGLVPPEYLNWALVVAVADTHVNSTVALCPPKVRRDDGGWYYATRAQGWIRECWTDFWGKVTVRRKQMEQEAGPGARVPVYVILMGDLVDINKHSKFQLIEYENPAIVLEASEEVHQPAKDAADVLFVLRGTEAHSGGAGFLEEMLARRLEAEGDPNIEGRASWYHLAMEAGGVMGDYCHHPQTTSYRLWTLESAASRQAAITWSEYCEAGERPPDVVGRAHTHQWNRGWRADTFCFSCPSWQLTTSFGHRLGAGRRVFPIGGVLIECRNGQAEVEPVPYRPAPTPIWKPVPERFTKGGDGIWTIHQE